MMLREITESLDAICVVEDPEKSVELPALQSLRNLIDSEIERLAKGDEGIYLAPSSSSRDVNIFLDQKQSFGKIRLKFAPSVNAAWDFKDLNSALHLMRAFLSRIIDPSPTDLHRKALFEAEAAKSIDNGASQHILLSSLPWLGRRESSAMLQDMEDPGLRSLSRRMACLVSYDSCERQTSRAPDELSTNHSITISPMIYRIDRTKIDPIELMRLISLNESGE